MPSLGRISRKLASNQVAHWAGNQALCVQKEDETRDMHQRTCPISMSSLSPKRAAH